MGLGTRGGNFLSISMPLCVWKKRSSTQTSAPKATVFYFFPKIMSAQDCEHEHIQLKHIIKNCACYLLMQAT